MVQVPHDRATAAGIHLHGQRGAGQLPHAVWYGRLAVQQDTLQEICVLPVIRFMES